MHNDSGCIQNIVRGKITTRRHAPRFYYRVIATVSLPGCGRKWESTHPPWLAPLVNGKLLLL